MPALSGADCRGCGAGEELHPSLSPGHTSSGGCGRALALRRMACLAACRRIPNPQERDVRARSTDRSRRAAQHACIAWCCAALILHRFLLLWCDDCPPLYGGSIAFWMDVHGSIRCFLLGAGCHACCHGSRWIVRIAPRNAGAVSVSGFLSAEAPPSITARACCRCRDVTMRAVTLPSP
jgi:hypothetical protein